jgi:hypothetical protein
MRKFLITFAALVLSTGFALAEDVIVVEPEVDTWIMEQSGPVVTYDADVVVGAPLPDTVEIVEVPRYERYGYVMLNKKRVLVERDTRKVIKVY